MKAVLLYTKAGGDLVVDPFSGTGTTHAACIRTGRAFAGCDIHFDNERRERLARIHPDLVTRLPGVTDESVALWKAEARPVRLAANPLPSHEEKRLVTETRQWEARGLFDDLPS